ncbi:MAG: NAD(P)-dependent oxidoreductase [Pseudomonadota bacterium]
MTATPRTDGIVSGRLAQDALDQNFADLHPRLDAHEAAVAADRCYFCYDAPCVTACPTDIDIPLFIRQIATGLPEAAAKTIFDQNILGGMCARVCPTEELCEEACVREAAEGKPVKIGQLQRFATDAAMVEAHPYARAAATGKRVAVVGAGPAGLACAHRLAMHGHDVTIYEALPKPGGLNEYGIAAYKTVDGFAQAEVDWLLQIGGIEIKYDHALGAEVSLSGLRDAFDAVFLGLGLGAVNALGAEGEDMGGVEDAVAFIAALRQSDQLASLPVGRRVVVIGGGMTAIDAAVQSKLLGAEDVTVVYRRSAAEMPASTFEQDLAASKGVRFVTEAMPISIDGNGAAKGVVCAYTRKGPNGIEATDETFTLPADQVLKAIGQRLDGTPEVLDMAKGKIAVTGAGRTSLEGVWAGGDCASGGNDLTVTAVAEGRDAAEDIHSALAG